MIMSQAQGIKVLGERDVDLAALPNQGIQGI